MQEKIEQLINETRKKLNADKNIIDFYKCMYVTYGCDLNVIPEILSINHTDVNCVENDISIAPICLKFDRPLPPIQDFHDIKSAEYNAETHELQINYTIYRLVDYTALGIFVTDLGASETQSIENLMKNFTSYILSK